MEGGRPHAFQTRSRALEVLSCEEISSSDSSDSSNDENQAKNVYAEGSNFRPPSSPPMQPPPTANSDDSDSKPFDITSFEDIVKSLGSKKGSTDNVHSGAEETPAPTSCIYGLSEHCLDVSDTVTKCERPCGLWRYIKDVCGYIAICETTDAGVVTTFRPWFVLTFAGFMLSLALFNVEDPMFGTMFIVILSGAYIFQVTLMNRRKTTKYAAVCNRIIQKVLDMSIHNVMPCSTCKDQFIQQGIFEFHNRVSSHLSKSHTCSAPYSGYDYLVAFLIWTMDKAMLELRGEGFITVDPSVSREAPQGSGTGSGIANVNNSNANMDYQPVPSHDESDYETPSGSDSNMSLDLLIWSEESSDSEGYESAMHQNSPTTSMNVNNDDAVTTTTDQDDFATFSLYTARSSVTYTADTYNDDDEDDEEEMDDGSESVNASTMSSNLTARTDPSCNGSEPTQQGSEDTTKSQYGSDGTNLTKSAPNSSRSRHNERAPKKGNTVAMGDNEMVSQLIAQSIKEHLVISPAASANEIRQQGYDQMSQMSESSYIEADTRAKVPYDTLNRNNNGNTFSRSRSKYTNTMDEEATIDGYGEYYNDETTDDEYHDDASSDTESTRHIPCSVQEESDLQLTYAADSVDYNLDESASIDSLAKCRGLSPDQEQQFGNNYFRNAPEDESPRLDCGDGENRNARFKIPTFGTILYPDATKRYPESKNTTRPDTMAFLKSPPGRGKHSNNSKQSSETVYVFPKPENAYPYGPHMHRAPLQQSPRQY